MVDFKKQLGKKRVRKVVDPIDLYNKLDRSSEKGPLRPAQESVLDEWHCRLRAKSDVIVKLHTGQGKTLVGLLMLQSLLNERGRPAVYLCPNNYLAEQTVQQAKQFGISVCAASSDLPGEFLDGKSILVTSVQKMFNGLTKFGLGQNCISVGSVILDDAHACIEAIRQAFMVILNKKSAAYSELLALFEDSLSNQGRGTLADIKNGEHSSLLQVPYWSWQRSVDEVSKILSKYRESTAIKFSWPLIKDMLDHCQCYFSGTRLEISPYLTPIEQIGSYYGAERRIFMSASVMDDSFLVKNLRVPVEAVRSPLKYEKESWSGEKMVLLPELVNSRIKRSAFIDHFGSPSDHRDGGVIVLSRSYAMAEAWEKVGAEVAQKETLRELVNKLRQGDCEKTLVLANRYDGVDLPDSSCRILILDGRPYGDSLSELYSDQCRSTSDLVKMRTARVIEQGMGRGVRGEKDYCVIVLFGADLVRSIRSRDSRECLSPQTKRQIEIGLEIVQISQDEASHGLDEFEQLDETIAKCLDRDEGWKEYYVDRMDELDDPSLVSEKLVNLFAKELEAELAAASADFDKAVRLTQEIVDGDNLDTLEKGWYLQQIARYQSNIDSVEADKIQAAAHKNNTSLLKPIAGMKIQKIGLVEQDRLDAIKKWVCAFDDPASCIVAVEDILGNIKIGIESNKFEKSLLELGTILGFGSQRPEREWNGGPDNLWALRKGEYVLIECKSEVDKSRSNIHKTEAQQMDRACTWFAKWYENCTSTNVIVHPATSLDVEAEFSENVVVFTSQVLKDLRRNVRQFFKSFVNKDLGSLSSSDIQAQLKLSGLLVDDLQKMGIKPSRVTS
jgi:replicative superfamily II helicase